MVNSVVAFNLTFEYNLFYSKPEHVIGGKPLGIEMN